MSNASPTRKTTRLREMLRSDDTEFLLEAHNGMSARIVEEAGFKGIWASGLAISAQHAVRDNNELSWTQVVDVLEFMSDVTTIPILVDGDTGYGDFNNMRRLVCKLEQRGIAGVCIEDKLFPKTNSFIQGEQQPLADIDEFCGKIKAGKDVQADPDFCIVARVEALIAGWGQEEALRRAEAYHAAGADAILIHSKRKQPDEVLAFTEAWGNRAPLVIVPTKYYSTPTDVFRRAGISVVIWANHMMRASIESMQRAAREIHETESLVNLEGRIATVSEIFRLQGAEELLEAERRYTRAGQPQPHAIILAATRGEGLESLTAERPKVMLNVAGKPVLRRLVDKFKLEGINDITVVAGYKADAIDAQGIHLTLNPDFEQGGELTSLRCALDRLADDTILLYGDLLFRDYILADLLHARGEITVVVDSSPVSDRAGNLNDLAYCSAPDDRAIYEQEVDLHRVCQDDRWQDRTPSGRWIGLARIRGEGRQWVLDAFDELSKRPDFSRLGIPDLLNLLVDRGHPVGVVYIGGHWLDVNNLEDLERAGEFARGHEF